MSRSVLGQVFREQGQKIAVLVLWQIAKGNYGPPGIAKAIGYKSRSSLYEHYWLQLAGMGLITAPKMSRNVARLTKRGWHILSKHAILVDKDGPQPLQVVRMIHGNG